jgi:hypothetical protein
MSHGGHWLDFLVVLDLASNQWFKFLVRQRKHDQQSCVPHL